MDADEKLTALKKAYADIILSISKEAATRVMASERKSARYEHELKVAKEEGVRMLLRLKQMMDSQIGEAEAASLKQQKKIEELEAQLQEAEDIVSDLREELRELQTELERVKNENLQHVNDRCYSCSRNIPVDARIYSYRSNEGLPPNDFSVAFDVAVRNPSQRNECSKCYNKIVCTCGAYVRNRDLPSIILRGKEPGLYRNGCTQRILACERNLLDKDLCLSEETDKVKDKKNCGEQEEGTDPSRAAPACGTKTLTELENKLLADIKLDGLESFPQKRKRAIRRRKAVIPLGGKRSYLSDHLPQHSVTNDPILVNDCAYSDEHPPKIGPRLFPDKAEPEIQLGCAESSKEEINLVGICAEMEMHKDEGRNDKNVPLVEETGFSDNLSSPDCKMDAEDLESNSPGISKERPSLSVGERVIKYTFQRKRKRQAPSRPEVDGSLETEKKTGDGKNDHQKLEQHKSSLLLESSRDSRRLAQVARQLISLSEKKWWR
ncbi:hypothetical protein Salat_1489300 [Sesamum alatum]|uniref:Uncharacterized protein n=1 Tax=Sesamum alatum TaxID=300844 RepID=A0AAE2CMD6_9LAMI|nr:hypothetical protein Salat_1489300 [Sesamum alatum]